MNSEPVSEFTPGEGTQLDDVESIEIWVSDYKTILHDGILFVCEKDSIVVKDIEVKADTEYEGAYLISVKVPAAVKANAGDVTVTFNNMKCIDGLDHSADLSATYSVATSIENILSEEMKKDGIYQLNGVKVNGKNRQQLPSGLYIINGKKMMICNK